MKMKMKHWALSLALVGMALPAMAQSGQPRWHLVSMTPDGASTLDVGRLERRGNVVVGQSAIYFAVSKQAEQGKVDFIQSLDAYDCSHPGAMRNLMAEGYRVGLQPPVFALDVRGEEPFWRTYGAGSAGMKAWSAACEGPQPDTELVNVETHEQVLDNIRTSLRKNPY